MVEQCQETASHSLPHKFYVGTGKTRAGFRNDVFVCDLHSGTIGKYRSFNRLGQFYLFIWMAYGFVVFIATALAGSFRWRGTWPYFLFVIPGVVLIIVAERFSLKKKAQYHMPVTSMSGSVWKDNDFSAPVL
jgi:hypothetical protein